jgi:hypothetical protein
MSAAADRRRALLAAALGSVQLPPQTSALRALHACLESWAGVVVLAVGMIRQGYDLRRAG